MSYHSLKRRLTQIAGGFAASVFLLATTLIAPASAVGLLQPKDGSLPKLDLKDHQVSVVIEDGYAITTIDQRFANPNAMDVEATYSFPVPRKGAVSEFTYWIDGKPVNGEVVEKKRARKIYQQEKAAGRQVALAEQDSHKTFDIKVWPVRAQKDVRIRLAYIQPTQLDTGIGRYLYPLEEGGVDEQRLAFWTANETVSGRFSFDLHLRPAYTIDALRLPKHPGAQITKTPEGGWKVHLDNGTYGNLQTNARLQRGSATSMNADNQVGAPTIPNSPAHPITPSEPDTNIQPPASQPVRLDTDIVVYWREKPGQPGTLDMAAYKADAKGRGSFMLTLTPGMDLKPVNDGRDWTFVLDKSGSMGGKISTLAQGISQALGKLRPNDRFRIFTFNQVAAELTNGFVSVTQENVRQYIDHVRNMSAGGSTNLFAGLQAGLDGSDADRTSAIILVTDGVANVGTTQSRAFLKLVEKKDIRLFTAIMGNSANRPLLEPLTRISGGTAFHVSNSDDIVGVLLQATGKVTHQALNKMKLNLREKSGSLKIADLERDSLRTLYRGEQLILFGHYWGTGNADIELSGKIGANEVSYKTSFSFPQTADLNPEIERLWAFANIEKQLEKTNLLGPDADRKQAVIDISTEYGIVTPYTSMLVLRDEVFKTHKIARTNQKRLAIEKNKRQTRAAQKIRARRVDTKRPMFNQSRPSHTGSGGGGSGHFGLIGLLLSLIGGLAGWASVRKGKL